METAIGRPAAQVVGEALNEALPADNPLRPLVDRALGGEGSRNVSFEVRSGDAPVQLVASAFPVMDPRESCDGAIVVLRDLRAVAVSPRAFQSLIQYSAQLAALGQVTAEVTHDVKNPLHAMVIHVAFLKERLRDGPDDVRRSLDTLDREIRRADSLVSRFQHVIRQDEISLKPLQLNTVLEEIGNVLDAQWTARGVTIERTLDPGLPPVPGDEEMLRRAFMNVVLNACQAMPDGGRVSIVSERENEGTGRFTVTDEGMGVAAADLEKIFLPYYTTKAGGSGIGLPLVRRVVEMHHGEIDVRSTVGQGTTVVVRLPLHTGP
jgi:signal transduction histidine kinase